MIFAQILEKAVNTTLEAEESFFVEMANALGWTGQFGAFGTITIGNLTIPSKYSKSGLVISNIGLAVEYALRLRMPDERAKSDSSEELNLDAIEKKLVTDLDFKGREIEVVIKKDAPSRVKVDSRSLVSDTDKWYLYIIGPAVKDVAKDYTAWLVRADALAMHFNNAKTPEQQRETITIPPRDSSIEEIDDAIAAIERQIDSIKNHLARQIFRKSGGNLGKATSPRENQNLQNTLPKFIGNSRVRFDIKFESLVRDMRKLIRESLREG